MVKISDIETESLISPNNKFKEILNKNQENLIKYPLSSDVLSSKNKLFDSLNSFDYDDVAVNIQKHLVVIQAKIDRLEYLSIKLDNSAEAFKALQLTKRRIS